MYKFYSRVVRRRRTPKILPVINRRILIMTRAFISGRQPYRTKARAEAGLQKITLRCPLEVYRECPGGAAFGALTHEVRRFNPGSGSKINAYQGSADTVETIVKYGPSRFKREPEDIDAVTQGPDVCGMSFHSGTGMVGRYTGLCVSVRRKQRQGMPVSFTM
jgi:hypothetical protein